MKKQKPKKADRPKAEILKEVKELFEAGLNGAQIARIVNRSEGVVSGYRKELGLPPATEPTWELIENILNTGLTQSEVARKLGVTRQRVSAMVKKHKP